MVEPVTSGNVILVNVIVDCGLAIFLYSFPRLIEFLVSTIGYLVVFFDLCCKITTMFCRQNLIWRPSGLCGQLYTSSPEVCSNFPIFHGRFFLLQEGWRLWSVLVSPFTSHCLPSSIDGKILRCLSLVATLCSQATLCTGTTRRCPQLAEGSCCS